jgi:hypothetical protein
MAVAVYMSRLCPIVPLKRICGCHDYMWLPWLHVGAMAICGCITSPWNKEGFNGWNRVSGLLALHCVVSVRYCQFRDGGGETIVLFCLLGCLSVAPVPQGCLSASGLGCPSASGLPQCLRAASALLQCLGAEPPQCLGAGPPQCLSAGQPQCLGADMACYGWHVRNRWFHTGLIE